MVAVNCAALSEKLVESELFGHKKGAFTGADKANLGYFRAANRGTLFLDEIQELPLAFQSKFLRAIERREVVPVGESTPIAIDIRIIVATQEPLTKLVREGRFRPDLQARIEGTTVELPPLRDRREDIVPLFRRFIDDVSAAPVDLEPRLVEALCTYDWPLNVRELLLLARRLAALHGAKSVLTRDHLPARFSTSVGMESSVPPVALPPAKRTWKPAVDDSEYEALLHALKAHQGNVSRAAAAIGIHRSRAYRLLAAHPEYGGANE